MSPADACVHPVKPPDFPVVAWLNVGKLVMFAALIVGAVWKLGAAAPPDGGPANTEFCAALDKVKVSAGVVVAVATEVVNNGERVPALKVVTVPVLPAPPQLPPDDVSTPLVPAITHCPEVSAVSVTAVP